MSRSKATSELRAPSIPGTSASFEGAKKPPDRRGFFDQGRDLLIGFGVQTVLFLFWLGMLWLLYMGILLPTLGHTPEWITTLQVSAAKVVHLPLPEPFRDPNAQPGPTQVAAAVAVLVMCLLPKVLTFCIATLIQQRKLGRMHYRLVPCPSYNNPLWQACVERVVMQWTMELGRARDGVTRIVQYAGFFGFVTSAALTCCALILSLQYFGNTGKGLRWSLALTVSSAVAISFGLNLGRIMVRAANRDSSARMFAWAARGQLLVIASAILLVAVLQQSKDELIQSTQGFLLIGAVIAIFGERALQSIADRAAKLLGVTPVGVAGQSDLTKLTGLGDEEIARLAEEGIETIHALALASTPRLHFQTPYTLQRICDWQDQALLATYMGNKAQLFRDQLMVRGATDAQLLADELLRRLNELEVVPEAADVAEPVAPAAGAVTPADLLVSTPAICNPFVASLATLDRPALTDLVKILGFGSEAQARVALGTLIEDDNIRRLRIFQRSSVEAHQGEERAVDPSEPD